MKNNHSIKPAICLLVLMFSACFAMAQKKEKAVSISFKVTRFEVADRSSPKFAFGSKEDAESVEIPLSYIAGPFKANLREGEFLDIVSDDKSKEKITIKVGASELKGLLLVFVPNSSGDFTIIKVNPLLEKMKGGDRYMINLTKSSLAIKLADRSPLLIKSYKSSVLRAPEKKDVASVLIKQQRDKAWELVTTEDWHFDRRFRKYLFVYRSARSKSILFHGVSERL